ncbi:hypothetical protein BGW39_004559 [Mortierella sp. 14UC]|nr:hypothetical protein BGW39_004559 [Mortierella sp. 14UC]
MATAYSSDGTKRTMRRDEDTTKFWSKVKRIHSDQDLNTLEKVQGVLTYLNAKFAKENLRMSAKAKQELLNQMEDIIEEGLRIVDEAEKNQRTARGHGVTHYLDRVQTILEGRF